MIEDDVLPGLGDLTPATLSRWTGRAGTSLLRLRYRQGKRAILHVGAPGGEGVLWFFAGDKGRHLARRNPAARFDAQSGALFEPFPQDHRLPEIAALLDAWPQVAPQLIGQGTVGTLDLLRYRPGLACTFRALQGDGRAAYVKVIGDDDVDALSRANARARVALGRGSLQLAPVLGVLPDLKTIAYDAAPGIPLDRLLTAQHPESALQTALTGLETLHMTAPFCARRKTAAELRAVARSAGQAVVTIFPGLASLVAQVLERLDTLPAPAESRQIHGDMKLEHVFLDGPRVTLIDTETMAVGPVDYDLAMLEGRLSMAAQDGILPARTARSLTAPIAARAGTGFDWCRNIVALRLAKFHAQHPADGAEAKAAALLRRLP